MCTAECNDTVGEWKERKEGHESHTWKSAESCWGDDYRLRSYLLPRMTEHSMVEFLNPPWKKLCDREVTSR